MNIESWPANGSDFKSLTFPWINWKMKKRFVAVKNEFYH